MRTHGRIATYVHGCRCPDCRRPATARRRFYRLRARPLPATGLKICPMCALEFHPRGFGRHEMSCLG